MQQFQVGFTENTYSNTGFKIALVVFFMLKALLKMQSGLIVHQLFTAFFTCQANAKGTQCSVKSITALSVFYRSFKRGVKLHVEKKRELIFISQWNTISLKTTTSKSTTRAPDQERIDKFYTLLLSTRHYIFDKSKIALAQLFTIDVHWK